MPEVTIKTEDKNEENQPLETQVIEKTLKAVDDYDKLKAQNDALEAELERKKQLEVRRDEILGGRAQAGQKPKTEQEKADEEAAKIIEQFT